MTRRHTTSEVSLISPLDVQLPLITVLPLHCFSLLFQYRVSLPRERRFILTILIDASAFAHATLRYHAIQPSLLRISAISSCYAIAFRPPSTAAFILRPIFTLSMIKSLYFTQRLSMATRQLLRTHITSSPYLRRRRRE